MVISMAHSPSRGVLATHREAAAFLALVATIVGVAGCHTHTPAQIRHHCLKQSHETVKVPEIDSANRKEMVRELYLRCLDYYGVPDAPPEAGSLEADY